MKETATDRGPQAAVFLISPLAATAALFGLAAFAGAQALAALQAAMPPAGYYRYLSWLAPAIGLAPIGAALGLVAAILAGSARDPRNASIGLLGGGLAVAGLVIALTHMPPNAATLKVRSMDNMRAITKALVMYEADHRALPPARGWMQSLASYVQDPEVWKDPFTEQTGYALNAAVAGRGSDSLTADPASIVAVFETDRGGAAGGPELLPGHPRHYGGDLVGFLDGHVAWVNRDRIQESGWMVWNPDGLAPDQATAERPGKR